MSINVQFKDNSIYKIIKQDLKDSYDWKEM